MQLGALRDQQQLWENYVLKMFVRRKLLKDAAPLKRSKQANVRARRARLGSKRGCYGTGWCLPVRARSLEPSAAKCSKRLPSGCSLAVTHSRTTAPTSGRVSECGVDVREGCGYVFGRAVITVLLVWGGGHTG